MKFIDLNSEKVLSVPDLKREFLEFKKDPHNGIEHETFSIYFFAVLMDTINGRNDIEIIGLTPKEIGNYIDKLHEKIRFE